MLRSACRSGAPFARVRRGALFVSAAAALAFGCGEGTESIYESSDPDAVISAELQGPTCIATVAASAHDGNEPRNAHDGDLTTRWSAEGDGAWLRYDFGSAREFAAVDLAWFRGNERVARFSIEVSSDAQTWQRVYHGQSSGKSTGPERHVFAPQSARYVRLVGHGNSANRWNSVTEMRFSAPALLSVAAVAASAHDGNVPENTLDDSLTTRWSAYGDGAWIRFDLGRSAVVTSADLAWYQGDRRVASFSLETSFDGTSWTRVHSGNSSGKTLQPEAVAIGAAPARYLRLVGHGNTANLWNSLTSVRVRGVLQDGSVSATPACGTTGGTSTTAPDLLLGTFDTMTSGGFGSVTRAALDAHFKKTAVNAYGLGDLSIVADGSGKALRQRYIPTSYGSPRVGYEIPLKGGMEVWASYRIYFEPGWEWVQGGKLPGLGGGSTPSGGTISDDGFTARLMWRSGGRLVVYAYHHDRPSKYGEDFPLRNSDGTNWIAPIGQWFTVRQRIKMNTTASTYDGEVEVWINGTRKLLKTGLRWRKTTAYTADRFYYSSFYGGNSSTWAPSKTTYARFDSFKAASSASGVD